MYTNAITLFSLLPLAFAAPQMAHPHPGSPPPPPAKSALQSNSCSQAVSALAAGIHLNIVGQWAELNGTLAVAAVEAGGNGTGVNMNDFLLAKGQLLSDIQAGMNIRLFNQQIAPPGNGAIAGLATYEAAQQAEQKLVQGLTGVPATDAASLNTLKSDIMAGIQLNTNNLKLATTGCAFNVQFPTADEMGV